MTDSEKKTVGVWATWNDYVAGTSPLMFGEANWAETVESVMDSRSPFREKTNLLICHWDGSLGSGTGWVPQTFFMTGNKQRRKVTPNRSRKLMDQRNNTEFLDTQQVQETAAEPSPAAAPPEEGELILNLSSHVLGLLATAFDAVSKGRQVTIRVTDPPQQ